MDKELDAVVDLHAPLPPANVRHPYRFEVNPVWVDAFIDIGIRFDPVTINVGRIWFLCAEAPINVNLVDTRRPERFDGGTEPLQKPLTPRRKTKALRYFLQRCLMVARRQRPSARIERQNQAISMISDTTTIVNSCAVFWW